MASACYGMMEETHVMLVDHSKENATEMVDLLKSYDYKVTMIGTYPEAVAMLSKGKKKIDVMIINIHSPNLNSFKLLAQAVALDIITLFVCDEHNELLAKKALKEGAYLLIKKPLNEEIVKYLWQFVFGKKIKKEEARKESEDGSQMNVDDINVPNIEEQSNNNHEVDKDVLSNGESKLRRKSRRKNRNEGKSQNCTKAVRRRNCTKWTAELHAKFMECLERLGEGKCFPKAIVEMMNVPGLTRMQVASHLQKCRFNNWRSPEERKSDRRPSGHKCLSGSQKRSSTRKFGTMPCLQKNIPNQIQRGPEFTFPTLNTNNSILRGESSIQDQIHPPQFHVQPHQLSIDNSLSSIPNSVGSQGLQGSIIGNTSYSPGLTFNIGDRHTQSDYNLDLNVPPGTTYSGRTTMSHINIENAISDELETRNAKFQQHIVEPNMPRPSNIVTTSYKSDTTESDSNEKKNCDEYSSFTDMDFFFQNLGPPGANLPNEYDSEFDQVYFHN